MLSPQTGLCETIYINQLLGDIYQLKKEKIIEENPDDLLLYELKKPRGEFTLEFLNSDNPVILEVGKLNYNQDSLYAKISGQDQVFLIADLLDRYIKAPSKNFRSKTLLFNHPSENYSIEFSILDQDLKDKMPNALLPKIIVQNRRNDSPQWVIVSPIHENAQFDAVNQFFQSLRYVQGIDIIDIEENDLEKFGLDKPGAKISFMTKNGADYDLLFAPDPTNPGVFFVKNNKINQVVVVPTKFVADIFNKHFRNEKLLGYNEGREVTKVIVENPGQKEPIFEFDRQEGKIFTLANDPEKKTLLRKILWTFRHYREQSFYVKHLPPYERKEFGLEPGHLRIKAYEKDVLFLDVTIGDILIKDESIWTYFEDNIRGCIMITNQDLLANTPKTMEDIMVTPETLEKYNRRKNNNEK